MTRTSIFLVLLAAPAWSATLTVSTTDDELNSDGDCALREAVQAANTDAAVDGCAAGSGADTIVIPAGTYVLTRTGAGEDANQTGDLDLTASVTLTGMGAATIDGNLTDRVLHVLGGNLVTVNGLTLTRGAAPTSAPGGAVLNAGTLTMNDCTLSSNSAGRGSDGVNGTTGGGGGAIASTGALTLDDCRFTSNSAGRGGNSSSPSGFPGTGGAGGAVSSSASLVVRRCTFTSNVAGASGTGGMFPGSSGLGGGIAAVGGVAITVVTDSTFTTNSGGASSGGFINHGGGIAQSGGNLTVRGSTFSGNVGQLGAGVFSTAATTVVNCTFSANVGSLRGGGFFIEGVAASVSSSTFHGNRAGGIASQGGATLTVRGSIVAGNRNPGDTGFADCESLSATLTSAGQNLFGAGTGCPSAAGDQTVAPATVATAVLNPTLTSSFGPTQTLMLVPQSPAANTGSCVDVAGQPVTTDQRGVPRPAAGCDVGAVETFFAAPVVVRFAAEAAGMNCAAGGQRLQTGADDGGTGGTPLDGVLQDGEVDQTQYLCNGAPGVETVFRTVTLAAGDAACPAGGVRIEAGRDDDGDGMLDTSEIDTMSNACAGASGATGRAALTRLTALAANDTRCAAGGSQLDTGTDDDGDSTLDATEIDSTAYLCNGPAGRSALVKVTSLGTGDSHCGAGGVQLDTGVDDDGDGALAAGEIDSTAYVCNGAAGAAGPAGSGGCQSAPGALFALGVLALRLSRRERHRAGEEVSSDARSDR